jgi:hypothetical protein
LRLAKLEALLAALEAHPGKAHTLGRCRVGSVRGRLGIFREVRRGGLPIAELHPGERMLWDNRFTVELGLREPAPIVVKALGEVGLRELHERSALPSHLPRLAGRTLPSCWRGETFLGVPELGLSGGEVRGLDCRASFIGAGRAERRAGTAGPASR